MRILVLNHEIPPVGGGGGRAAEDLCRVLAKRGHKIKVLTSHLKGLPYKEQRDGYQIIRIPSLRTQPFRVSFLSMVVYVLAGLWVGFRLIRAFQPELIHVHFAVPAGALAWMLSKITRVPYILTAHLGDVPGGVPEKTTEWFRWVFPFTHSIWHDAGVRVAVSQYTRELALQNYSEEMVVIPNGVDVAALKPQTIQVNEPPVIVFAGRFMPQKDPLQVVQTLKELTDLSWKCVMIGDGPLLPDVKKMIVESNMQDRFILTSWITPGEVMQWLNGSDILFMPSLSEGLPIVGVQALAKGLAIIASRVGGFVDLVDEAWNGHLIERNDMVNFSVKLRKLLEDQGYLLSLRHASLEKAKSFEINRIADQYESIFLEMIGQERDLVKAKFETKA